MKNRKINFTKGTIESLKPGARPIEYHDIKTPHLSLRVTCQGTKTFYLCRWFPPEQKGIRVKIGCYPACPPEVAREEAIKMNADVSRGINPLDARRELKAEQDFESLFKQYLNQYAKLHKKTWLEDEKAFYRHLKPLASMKISRINRNDIEKLHAGLGETSGPYTANRILSLIQTIFSKALDWEYLHRNPAVGIRRFKEQSRERFLSADELKRLFRTLSLEIDYDIRDFILLSLLTGARKANVLSMQWKHIDLEQKRWFIPETKNGTSQTIPLVDPATEIILSRKNKAKFVFPGTGKDGYLRDPRKSWLRVLRNANIDDLRIHDLRRTLGSWEAITGASMAIIGKTLNHKDVSSTAIYARLSVEPVRDAMNKAAGAMFDGFGGSLAEVIPLRKHESS